MDDIRRVKKTTKIQENNKKTDTESSIDKVFAPQTQSFEKPQKRNIKFWSSVLILSVLAVVFVVFYYLQPGAEPISRQPGATSDIQENQEEERGQIFQKDKFYGINTKEGKLYFAKVEEKGRYYYLKDVFFDDTKDISTSTSATLRLVRFGSSEEDVVILPAFQVKEIFPLKDDSPILQAIQEYLDK